MFSFNLVRWVRSLRRSRIKTIQKTPRIRLRLEELESRLAPATFTWIGASGSSWSTAANWQEGFAPKATDTTPANLVFGPLGAGNLNPVNNISNLTVGKIDILANGYNLKMQAGTLPIKLGNASFTTTVINVGASLTNETIELDMALASGTQHFFTVGSGSLLTVSGKLSGPNTSQITKTQLGTGTLVLTGNNAGFAGPVNIEHDAGIVRVGHSAALGTGAVTVNNNSQLQLQQNPPTGGDITVANALTLFGPGVSNFGSMRNVSGDNSWTGPISLGSNTAFNADNGTSLNIAGSIGDLGSGFNVNKIGQGTVIFSNANSYRGSTTVTDGILTVQHPRALGSVPAAGTVVLRNPTFPPIGTLRLEFNSAVAPTAQDNTGYWTLQNPALPFDATTNPYIGFVVHDVPLTLNAGGFSGNGALDNFAGNNTWTGNITLGSPAPVGANVTINVRSVGTTQSRLFLQGVIGDVALPSGPFNLRKIGTGDLVLQPINQSTGNGTKNLYHGTTLIVDGTLTLRDSQGLGPATKTALTTVLDGASLNLESNVGHIDSITNTVNRLVVSAPINIDGDGYALNGALHSVSGINVYTVTFVQSPVQDVPTGVLAGNLTDGTTYYYVVTALDTYGESLASNQEFFTASATEKTAHVSWQAVPGATGYNVYRTTTSGDYTSPALIASNVSGLFFDDLGNNAVAGTPPIVRPIITINQNGLSAAIGVDAEPNQTPNNDYFTNDYSLTINGGITDAGVNQRILVLNKVGTGHLILPNANNTFFGPTNITQGWITIQDPNALGGPVNDVQEVQPLVTVDNGAALMLKPFVPGTSFTFTHNLNLTGVGVLHPYDKLKFQGAVENLAGVNTLKSNIFMNGHAGFGVEKLYPDIASDLTLAGEQSSQRGQGTISLPDQNASGGSQEYSLIVDTGSVSGTITVTWDHYGIPDFLRVYYGPRMTAGSTKIFDTGLVSGSGTATFPYGPGTGTQVEFVMDEGGGSSGTAWEFTATINPDIDTGLSGLLKLGSQRLNIEGPGTYFGGVEVRQGVVRALNNTALGTANGSVKTVVQAGAALEIAPQVSGLNGGLDSGVSVWNNRLILNGTGNSTFGDAPLTILSKDVLWAGPVTLNSSITVNFEAALANTPVNTFTTIDVDALGVPTLTGTTPTVDVFTTTPGGNGLNAAQTFVFGGTVTGGFFRLIYDDGVNPAVTTGNIYWDANPNTLITNVRNALSAIPALTGNFAVALMSPTINVMPNSRFVITGKVDDGAGTVAIASPLIHDYQLNGGPADALGGPPVVNIGGTFGATSFAWDAVANPNNEGLTLDNALPTPDNYAIEMRFTLNSITSELTGGSWVNLIDFKNRTSDEGLYARSSGALEYYPSPTGPGGAIAAGTPVHLVITRDAATDQFVGYINGVQQISFVDGTGDTIFNQINNTIHFFIDDDVFEDEVSGGSVDFIRIYSRPLTSTEVNIVFNGGTLGTTSSSATTPADLHLAGGGEVLLAGDNTYRGTTFVHQGILTIANGQALGGVGVNGQQELALTGAAAGVTKFKLTFAGEETTEVTYTGTAADAPAIQAALNALASIGGSGASVAVVPANAGVFLVTFSGSLAGNTSQLITAEVVTGTPGQAVAGVEGGTVVADRAQLQLEGGITVSGEHLVIQGTGNNLESAVQTFTVGSTTVLPTGTFSLNFNGAATDTGDVPFYINAGELRAALQKLTTIEGAGGQVDVNIASFFAGLNETQQIDFTNFSPGDTYQLYFDPASGPQKLGTNLTFPIRYSGNPFTERSRIVAALQSLRTISDASINGTVGAGVAGTVTNGEFAGFTFLGGLADQPLPLVQASIVNSPLGTIGVTRTTGGQIGTKTYSVVFQGSMAQQAQPEITVTGIAGSTTVTNPVTTIVGGSPNATPAEWFAKGPAPITGAVVFNGTGVKTLTAGRVTGIDVQQSFANDIYIATAGGGLWKTIDGGLHWTPMFDNVNNAPMFGGAVTIVQNTPNQIYFGTGEGSNSGDSYYGSGVYLNGTLLKNLDETNPLAGKAINRIVYDPNNPLVIWVAVSDDFVTNGTGGGAGIWRYDASQNPRWVNTTDAAGFVANSTSYSDLALIYDPFLNRNIIYAAIGDGFDSSDNDILVSDDDGATWTAANIASVTGGSPGNIKLAITSRTTAYASIADASFPYGVLSIVQTTDAGATWTSIADFGGSLDNLPGDYLASQGYYNNAITARTVNGLDQIFVGGVDQGNGTNFILWGDDNDLDGDWTFADISQDPVTGDGPHTDVHGLALDSFGNLVVGTDGGVWRAAIDYAAITWRWDNVAQADGTTVGSLNGDLAISQMNSVSGQPGQPATMLGGARGNGIALTTGGAGWQQVVTQDGGLVRYVPTQSNVAYASRNGQLLQSIDGGQSWNFVTSGSFTSVYFPFAVDPLNPGRVMVGGDVFTDLRESLDQGNSFITLQNPITNAANSITSLAIAQYQGAYQPDPAFPSVIDMGANSYAPDTFYIASATQLYVTKNHATANTWSTNRRPVSLMAPNTTIQDIAVDPADSNIIYLVANGRVGSANQKRVFVSTHAGRIDPATDPGLVWHDISNGLPDLPAWKLVIDPRTNDLYLGTDIGVYKTTISFAGGVPVISGWQKFGAGLPNVQVKDLELNTTTNALLAGTYGRGVWQFYLNENTLPTALVHPGALRAIGGHNAWNGPVVLAGDTTINANGSQALQNGLSASSLTIGGQISDSTTTTTNTLTKIGGGDVILSGINTYAGVTDVREGNLDVQNASALGGATIVGAQGLSLVTPTPPRLLSLSRKDNAGSFTSGQTFYYVITAVKATGESIASNELTITTNQLNQAIEVRWSPVAGATGYRIYRSGAQGAYPDPSLLFEVPLGSTSVYLDDGTAVGLMPGAPPVFEFTLQFGTGAGSQTGTLQYTGTAADAGVIEGALNGLATIGGAAASVTVMETSPGLFLITFAGSLAGTTQPILPTSSGVGYASLTPAGGSIVQNGAALKLESDLNLEPITLNGNGIQPNYSGHFTGALRSLTNDNTYTGTVTLNTNSTIGVDAGSTLTFTRDPANPNPLGITDNGVGYSLEKESAGTLVLQTVDSYGSASAGTTVNQGILNVQNSNALGIADTTTKVLDGAQLQLQRSTATRPTQNAPTLQAGGTLTVGTTYYYVIVAITPVDESVLSNEQFAIPITGDQTVGLSWNAVIGAIGYRIFRSTTAGVYVDALLTTINSGATTSYLDTGAAVAVGTPFGPLPVNVETENLILSGTGIAGTGAMLNVDGNNTWGSTTTTVLLTSAPGFSPIGTPKGTVAFGVAKATDTLTIGSPIMEQILPTDPLPDGPVATGLTKVGLGRLTLAQDNTYTGTTYVNEGMLAIQTSEGLGNSPADEIQRVTVFDTLGTNTFTLTFKGQTTAALTFGATLGASDVEDALNALSTILGVGGFVTVTRSTITVTTPTVPQTGYIYTVTFHNMPDAGQPLITATPTGGINISVNRVADGGIGAWIKAGAALELDGDPLGVGGGIDIPASESLLLDGTTGVGGLGGLRSVSGENTWQAPITLQTSLGIPTDSIGVDAGSELTVTGLVQDPAPNPIPSPIPPASLTKVGAGTLVFPIANTYTGSTFVNGGALNVQHANSLGVQTSAVQTIAVSGTSGTFKLTFKGQTTGDLNVGIPASGGVGPTASMQNALNALSTINAGGVIVTQLGNVYSVYFAAPALAFVAQPLITATVAAGFGTTVAITPAILGGESATVVAAGASLQLESAASLTESSDKTLFLNGQGVNNSGALDSVAGSNQIEPTTRIILQSNASLGAEASALLSVTQAITDRSQTQTITFPFAAGTAYTLSFDGLATGSLVLNATPANNVTAIRDALNALANIKLLGGAPVNVVHAGGSIYDITFGGRMVGTDWPALVVTRVVGGTMFNATTQMNTNGFGITKYGPGTAEYVGTAANVYTGLTHVVEGTLELSKPDAVNAIAGNLQVGTPGIAEVQSVTITGTSGTFALTFNGQTTGNLAYNVPASGGAGATACMENALNALPSIGGVGGFVTVTKLANVYTVTFDGTLRGADLPLLGVSGSAGGNANAVTDGSRFSPANSAIAELTNRNQIVNTSNVVVNGDGLLDLNGNTEDFGTTLKVVDGQVNTGAASLVLLNGLNMAGGLILNTHATAPGGVDLEIGGITATSTATGPAMIRGIGNINLVNATRTFTINDGPNASDLVVLSDIADLSGNTTTGITKTGAGRLELGAANSYQGLTTIDAGDVQVDSVERITLSGFSAGNQFTLQLNGTVSAFITYTGVTATDAAAIQVALNAVLASLGATGTATVEAVGADTFNVLFGGTLANNDLETLTGAGPGTINVSRLNTIDDVRLNGGSVSGGGTLQTIMMATASAVGTVNPGNNGSPAGMGILDVNGNVILNVNSTFSVDLKNTNPGSAPIAGIDHDQLNVAGNVVLGTGAGSGAKNALLVGSPGAGIQVGDQFTILRATGTITGLFDGIIEGTRNPIVNGGTVFLNGQKFTVRYFANRIVLTRELAVFTSITMTVDNNPSVYGQEVTYRVIADPEPGASLMTANPVVTFNLDGSLYTQSVAMNQTTGIATFTPQSHFGLVWVPGVNHTISAVFTDSADVFATINPTPNPIIQTVELGKVNVNLSSVPSVTSSTPAYGQTVDVIATISPVVTPNVPGASNPTGNVKFVVDSNTYFIPINPYAGPPAAQTAILTLPGNLLLSPGPHFITAEYVGTPNAYAGDGNYAPSATPVNFNLTIQPDTTTVTFPTQPTSSNLGQTATFKAQVNTGVAGSPGVPTGFINFYDGTTLLNSSPIAYSGGIASYSTSTLSRGAHNIIAKFTPTDGNYKASDNTSNPFAFTVNAATTTTSITSVSPASPIHGQPVTFNMQVVPNPQIAAAFGLPTGTIQLRDGSQTGPILRTGAINPANGQTTVITTAFALSAGNHTLYAVYVGDGQFGTSFGTFDLTVAQATTNVTLSANPANSATWQPSQPIVLSAAVTSPVGAVPMGAGSTVTFLDTTTGATLGTANVGAGGIATLPAFQANTLSVGAHVFKATYNDAAGNFASDFDTLNYAINNAPTTVTSITPDIASPNAVYGQPIALTAAVDSPAGAVNTGIVTFVDTSNANLVLGTAPVSAGSATLANITTLTAGFHNIRATYTNTPDNFFLSSFNTLSNYFVNQAETAITSFTNTPSPSAQTKPVVFSVTVTAQNPSQATVKEGTVKFTDITGTPVTLGSVNVINGVANLSYSALPLGTRTIQAEYIAATTRPNFLNSPASTITHIVRKLSTVNVSAIAGAKYGQPLNYTVTVTGTPGTPTGTITLTEGATTHDTANLVTIGGVATATISVPAGLDPGTHTLLFSYSGDSVPSFGFAPSSKTILQSIAAAGTTTTLDPLSAVAYGTQVTFTATVTTNSPSQAADPTAGSVTFKDGTKVLGTKSLAGSNVVSFTTTTPLTKGAHIITAVYSGAPPHYTGSTSTAKTQTVNAVGTTTTLGVLSDVFYGQAVTFSATVTSATGVTPVGTVRFKNGSTVLATKTLVNGAASFTTTATQLKAGNHIITVVYTPSSTNFLTSTSAADTQTVTPATTATTLTSSSPSNTSMYGQSVTFTAVVAATSAGSPGTPSGTVTFRANGNLLATVALVSGKATYKTSALIADPAHTITATYNPTTPPGNFTTSDDELTQAVDMADTTTKLTSSPTYWAIGQTVAFTATVTSVTGAVPNGSVTFTIDDSSGTIADLTVNLVGGVAKQNFTFPFFPDTYTVTATYNPATVPNQNFNPNSAASASVTQDVRKASTATLSSVSNTSGVMLSAKITGAGGIPTGTVDFYEIVKGVQVFLGQGNLNASGVASFFAKLATGSHTILAVYSGDTNFNPASVTKVVQGKITGRLV